MLERPDLPDEKIAACLEAQYALPVAGLEFLQLGQDSNSFVYRVNAAGGGTYFLKVKKGDPYLPSLAVPRHLQDHGIRQVVAPLPARSGELWQPLQGFSVILYPFIKAASVMETGMPEAKYVELGALLKQIHSLSLPAEITELVKKESFNPVWEAMFAALRARIDAGGFSGPYEKDLAALWKLHQEEIFKFLERTLALSRLLKARPQGFVLCHADFHTGNILYDGHGGLYIVDWDDLLLAPKERDLMFVTGAAGSSVGYGQAQKELFYRGYGETEIDPFALTYYQYDWAAQDLADFGRRVLLDPQAGDETKAEALHFFSGIFNPGESLDLAYRFDRELIG